MSYSQLLAASRPPASFVTILRLSFATNVILKLQSASPADLWNIPGVDRVLAIFLWAQQSEQSALRIRGWETSGYLQLTLHCHTPFYIRDLSNCRFWYLRGLLEPIPRRYRGTTVFHSGLSYTVPGNLGHIIVRLGPGKSIQQSLKASQRGIILISQTGKLRHQRLTGAA